MNKIMTREEYEANLKILQAEYKCDSDYYQSLCDLDGKYIASIEAKLNAEISKLKKALDLATKSISDITGSCPLDTHDLCMFDEFICNKFPTGKWGECWKEYFITKAEDMKDV